MTRPHHDGPTPPGLLLPPIEHLPGPAGRARPDHDGPEGSAASARPWGQLPVSLSRPVTCALWILLIASAGFGGWLVAVLSGAASCEGFVCAAATFSGHTDLLLVLASSCVVLLLGAATVTRGLTRANGPQLAVIAAATVAGTVALLGIAAVLLLVTLATVLAGSLLALFVERTR